MINTKEYFRQYYLKNKEKLNANSRAYYGEYYLKNADKINAKSRESYFKKNYCMIEQRNCKQCDKLFSPKKKNSVSCSFDCMQLLQKRGASKENDYFKNYRKEARFNNKKIKMPKFNYNINNYNWDEIDKL